MATATKQRKAAGTCIADFPELAELAESRDGLREQRDELQARLAELRSTVGDERRSASELEKTAAMLPDGAHDIRDKLEALRDIEAVDEDLRAVQYALAEVEKRYGEAHALASATICRARLPELQQRAQNVVDTLAAFLQAVDEHGAFTRSIEDDGAALKNEFTYRVTPQNFGAIQREARTYFSRMSRAFDIKRPGGKS